MIFPADCGRPGSNRLIKNVILLIKKVNPVHKNPVHREVNPVHKKVSPVHKQLILSMEKVNPVHKKLILFMKNLILFIKS